MILYLHSKLDLNRSCAKDFQNHLVYKLQKIVGSNHFSAQFIKIISHYKKIGYINVLQQTATWWSTQWQLATLLASLIACRWVGLQTLWWFRLKYLSIDEMVGVWCFGCCQATRVYLLDFFCQGIQFYLLLSPYLCFISWFICSLRWCIDKLGVFHANQTPMCLDPHQN